MNKESHGELVPTPRSSLQRRLRKENPFSGIFTTEKGPTEPKAELTKITLGELLDTGAPLVRVGEIRREKKEQQTQLIPIAPDMVTRNQVLTNAIMSGDSIVFGWQRLTRNGPIDIVVGAPSLIGDATDTSNIPINYPAAARGEKIDTEVEEDTLDNFTHVKKLLPNLVETASVDAMASFTATMLSSNAPEVALEAFVGDSPEPFSYLVRTRAISRPEIKGLLEEKDRQVRQESPFAQRNGAARARSESAAFERTIIADSKDRGLSEVAIFIGAHNDQVVEKLANVVTSSTLNPFFSFSATPETYSSIGESLAQQTEEGLQCIPTGNVNMLMPIPKKEIPGVRITSRPRFDVISEIAEIPKKYQLEIGRILDNNNQDAGSFCLDLRELTSHAAIGGMTGATKTSTGMNILEALADKGVTWTVWNPAKAHEYDEMGARLAEHPDLSDNNRLVSIIRPGELDRVPIGFNVLEEEPGFEKSKHMNLIIPVLGHSLPSDREGEEITDRFATIAANGYKDNKTGEKFEGVYERKGWNYQLGESRYPEGDPAKPTMSDLGATVLDAVEKNPYGDEISSNMKGFLGSRFKKLGMGAPGDFLERSYPLDFSKLMSNNAIFETDELTQKDSALIMGATLVRMIEHLKVKYGEQPEGTSLPLSHVFMIDEAHVLLEDKEGSDSADRLASLLAECRTYGLGVIVLDQIPSKLHPGAIKNTATKIMHQLPGADDRAKVGTTMNLNEDQSNYATTLPKGEAIVFTRGFDQPIRVQMNYDKDRTKNREHLAPPTRLLGIERDEWYTKRERIKAAEYLEETDHGRLLDGWNEVSTISKILDFGDIKPDENYREELFDGMLKENKRETNCAIEKSLTDIVNGEHSKHLKSREEALKAISQRTQTHLAGEASEEWNLEVSEKTAELVRYINPLSNLETFLRKHVKFKEATIQTSEGETVKQAQAYIDGAVGRHPSSDTWESHCGHDIPGDTALEQYTFLRSKQKDTGLAEILFSKNASGVYPIDQAVDVTGQFGEWGVGHEGAQALEERGVEGVKMWLEGLSRFLSIFDMDPRARGLLIEGYKSAFPEEVTNSLLREIKMKRDNEARATAGIDFSQLKPKFKNIEGGSA